MVSTLTSVTAAVASIRVRGEGSPWFQSSTAVPTGTAASNRTGVVSDPFGEVTLTRAPSVTPIRSRNRNRART